MFLDLQQPYSLVLTARTFMRETLVGAKPGFKKGIQISVGAGLPPFFSWHKRNNLTSAFDVIRSWIIELGLSDPSM